MKFYQFNHAPMGEKYREMSKAEYELAKREPYRWFIDFDNCVIEYSEEEYWSYYQKYYHSRNSRRDKNTRAATEITLDSVNEAYSYEMSVFSVHTEQTVEDRAICRIYQDYCKQRLLVAFEALSSEEVYLVLEMTLRFRKQKELAAELGVSQQAISRKYLAALRKLRQLLSDLER